MIEHVEGMRKGRKGYKTLLKNLKGRVCLGDLDVDVRK
jgi:hypothetical protein